MSVSPSVVPGDQYLGGLFMFLCRAIRERLFLTVLPPLVATAIAYLAALQLPPVYTAQGSIRIGKVDGADKTREPLEADIKAQLSANDATIAGLLEMRDSLSALAKEDPKGASGDAASIALRRVWLSDLIARNEQRLTAARAEWHALSAKLAVWRTYPTALRDDAFVSPGFALARPVTIAILSGAIVFVVFLLGVVLRGPKGVRPD